MSLKKRTISGMLWTFGHTVFVKGFSFIAMLLLARWLGPVEFGLMGMIAVFVAIGTSLVDSGLTASIIRTKNATEQDYDTVFYMNLAMSGVVYALLFFMAPLIADFYGQDVLVNVLRIYCLSFIIAAFSATQQAILTKEMRFKQITILNAPGTIIGALAGLILGYFSYGVWSIVAMYLINQLILSILLWVRVAWKPGPGFSRKHMRHHYKFGYKLMLSGLLNTLFNHSYYIVIGKFFPVQNLGFFERAMRFNEYPSKTFTEIIDKVTYPMLAELQDNTARMATIYKRLLRITFFCAAPVMLGAAAIAHPLFKAVLGTNWLPAVPYFQILSLAAMLYPIHAFNLNVLKVYGRSDWFLKLEILKKAVISLALVIGFQYGMLGLVWSIVFSSFIALFINTYYSSRLIQYSPKEQLLDMLPILLLAGCTYLLMYRAVIMFSHYSNTLQIVLALLLGVFFYFLVSSFIKRSSLHDMILLLKSPRL